MHHQILNRWKKYCTELYSDPNLSGYYLQGFPAFDADLPPLRTEIEKALRELKKTKALSFDDVPAELLQASGDAAAVDVLHKLCVRIWQEKEWPEDWTKAIFALLP